MCAALVLVAGAHGCANGGDVGTGAGPGDDDGGVDLADSGGNVDGATPGHDSGATSHPDGGGAGGDAGAESSTGGDGSTTGPDGSPGTDASSTDAGADDGSTPADSSTPPDTGTTSGGVCGSDGKYAIEAAAAVASGTITFCFGGTCSAGDCCYEQLNPGNICVKQ
ncbi:MAG: hypothetical protein ACRELB_20600 [Polyangiaceae bacterium]